ncbi:MAG: lysine 5,6-aminomutase subunit alpha [bacterium]|nr:lysine 5,6-aminomutase subunit alpha [bacterium]
MKAKLRPDPAKVAEARKLASEIVSDVLCVVSSKSTVTVERAVLRLLGVDGIDEFGVPIPNAVVEWANDNSLLSDGIAPVIGKIIASFDVSPQKAAEMICEGRIEPSFVSTCTADWKSSVDKFAYDSAGRIASNRRTRAEMIGDVSKESSPYLYCIVATGNIYEDVIQAQAAARQGAQIIAVIRSTAQSLLDYVPYGATTEGFGGTYATQENFRIMRKALDETGKELGRYIRLCNYCSGLCMPEIAAMGALERLDVMLNDAIYGIIFRDINMIRTLTDQNFSRKINAFANIVINTGEDNYLTTADAVTEAHTVLASQFINEEFGLRAGLRKNQLGLGHAFEMDPDLENGFLLELAQAQTAREIFPESPLKYMPPTKFMTGNIFRGHVQDSFFTQASVMTGQTIHLLGMLTEAIHTPFMHDRFLAIESAKYIVNNQRALCDEISFENSRIMKERSEKVLSDSLELLRKVREYGLFGTLERGIFAGIKRPFDGGKGREGVFDKGEGYYNPFDEILSSSEEYPAPLRIDPIYDGEASNA